MAMAVMAAACTGDQVEAFIRDVQPITGSTIRDGEPVLFLLTCGANVEGMITVSLIGQGGETLSTTSQPVLSIDSADGKLIDGVLEFNLRDDFLSAGIDPGQIADDQWIAIGFSLDNGYSTAAAPVSDGPWTLYPTVTVIDPSEEEILQKDMEQNPLICPDRG